MSDEITKNKIVELLQYFGLQLESANSIGANAISALLTELKHTNERVASDYSDSDSKLVEDLNDEINKLLVVGQYFDRQTQQITHTQRALFALTELLQQSEGWPENSKADEFIKSLGEYCSMPEEQSLYEALISGHLLDKKSPDKDEKLKLDSSGDVELF